MTPSETHVVTGAFSYTGRALTERLLDAGITVRTLTGHPERADPFGGRVRVSPLAFDRPDELARSLEGARVLYNTYWVRFAHGRASHEVAVANSGILFEAARRAGVERVVHISITNPDATSDLPYFRGKAEVEATLTDSGLSHAILRPTVLFGRGDILINNIAYLLRRLPLFGIFGKGEYRLQPLHVDDLAQLMMAQAGRSENVTLDAVGPEIYTYRELVERIRRATGARARIVSVPPALGLVAGRLLGLFVGDVPITRDEIAGLSRSLLVSAAPPTGSTSFAAWLEEHRDRLGRVYANELKKHYWPSS
ncbi:MAG: NAD(P)H-binding protein [Planctomycetota bacterium]